MECSNCHRKFKSEIALKRHMHIKRKCKVKPLICPNCERGFSCKKSLMTHTRIYCKGINSAVDTLTKVFFEWITPFVNIDSPLSTWQEQCDTYLQRKLINNEMDFIDVEQWRHILVLYIHCYSILKSYNASKRYELLKLLIKLFRYDKFNDDSFLYIITAL